MLRVVGKALISVGVGFFLFVGWTFWGTGIYTRHQQERLRNEFAAEPPMTPRHSEGTGFFGPAESFAPKPGETVFQLTIPSIEADYVVVQGVDEERLKLGPGHYPDCRPGFTKPLCTDGEEVWPGEEGRVIISGHRTTYDAPFFDLDELQQGDEIITSTRWGKFVYEVVETKIVPPESTDIANPDPVGSEAEIVLTTCHPVGSASERLIVFAQMELEN